MTLNQIDQRLQLFPQYLRYRVDNWENTPWGRIHTYRTAGMIWCHEIDSFDTWLHNKGYDDLVYMGTKKRQNYYVR